jgi:hypothetical protein
MQSMSKVLANGQLAVSSTAMFTATGPDQVNITLANTSGSNNETIILKIQRTATGTARRFARFVLNTNEWCLITGLPVESGDVLLGQTTDATTVDFDVSGQGIAAGLIPAGVQIYIFDANGGIKQVNTQSTVAGALTCTSASANSLAVGPNGTSNPALQVDSSAASAADGVKVVANAAGTAPAIATISSGANEGLTIDGKGTGALTLAGTSTGQVSIGRGSTKVPIGSSTKTTINAQNGTPTAAQQIGGYLDWNTQTGAGTLTLDTAANTDTALTGAANGDMFTCQVVNRGNQTGTITTNTGLTLRGTVAIPTLKNAIMTFVRTGAGAYDVICNVSA